MRLWCCLFNTGLHLYMSAWHVKTLSIRNLCISFRGSRRESPVSFPSSCPVSIQSWRIMAEQRMKQGCLSWNTNTLLTLCLDCTLGQNDSRALRRKSYLAQRRGFFSSLLVPKNKPKNSPSWESGTKKLEGCWPAPAPAVPRPREDAPISSPRSRRTTQAATAAAAKVLLKLAGEIDQICSSTVWLGEIYQVCSSTFQVGENDHWSRPSQYFKLRGTRSTSFFSVYQTWVNREETYYATWQLQLVQYFWAWDACYWSKKGLWKPNLDQGNGCLLEVIVKLQVLLLDQSCFRSWQL